MAAPEQESVMDKDGEQEQNQASGDAADDKAVAAESTDADEQHAEQGNAVPSTDELLGQIAALQAQADELQQRLLRSQADFDNFRRRTRQEKEEFAKYASQKLIEQLLPVVDNFERAVSASRENKDFDALIKGVEMIFRQLDQVLVAEGLAAMQAVGQPFNPELHQAVMQVESAEHGEGIVAEELQKGYMLKDKVLRPAMVKVSK